MASLIDNILNGGWGSAGAPSMGGGDFEGGTWRAPDPTNVDIGGQTFWRKGEAPNESQYRALAAAAGKQFSPEYMGNYDPTYGYVVPQSTQYDMDSIRPKEAPTNGGGIFDYGPFLLSAAALGGIGAGAFGGAGGVGAEAAYGGAGLFGPEGSLVGGAFGAGPGAATTFGGGLETLGAGSGFATDPSWGVNFRDSFSHNFLNGKAQNTIPEFDTSPTGTFDAEGMSPEVQNYQSPFTSGNIFGQNTPSWFGNATGDVVGKLTGSNPINLWDVGKAGANYLIQNSLADKYSSAAQQAANKANTLNDPRRGPYQAMLSQLLTNPQQFYSQNPVVQGQLDLARQQFNANTAKMGTGGTQFNDYLKNVQNIASGTFNDQANLLSGLGGFNQGAGYSGNVFANLQGQGIQQSMEAFRGLGQQIFGKLGASDNQNTSSPSNTKIVSSY